MAKKTRTAVKAEEIKLPSFQPGQMLAVGVPTIVADTYGKAWLLDPLTGMASPIGLLLRGGAEVRRALGRSEKWER